MNNTFLYDEHVDIIGWNKNIRGPGRVLNRIFGDTYNVYDINRDRVLMIDDRWLRRLSPIEKLLRETAK